MNITKRDVQELRKRLTKKACTFDRVTGCYINSGKEVILKFSESFMNLAEEEFFKYLEIAKKAFSGSLGKNLLELEFERTEEAKERQQFLQSLRTDEQCTDELIEQFFAQVMENYHAEGSYLVLLFHDIYDVPVRTKDRQKLDDSEEVYEYILCAICPVELSKAALGYREEENRIGARERDWVVGMPEIGFVYPAFSKRSADVNAMLYYAKGESHPEMISGLLGCTPCRTSAEEKLMFEDVVNDAFGDMQEQAETAYMFIQRNLDDLIAIREETEEGTGDLALTAEDVADVISDIEMPDLVREAIVEGCAQMFGDEMPAASHLLDAKLAEEGARRAQIIRLEKKITTLEQELDEAWGVPQEDDAGDGADSSTEPAARVPVPVRLRLPQERRSTVRAEVIDGKRCIVIPLEEGETASVNGNELPLWPDTEAAEAETTEASPAGMEAAEAEATEASPAGMEAAEAEATEPVASESAEEEAPEAAVPEPEAATAETEAPESGNENTGEASADTDSVLPEEVTTTPDTESPDMPVSKEENAMQASDQTDAPF